MDFRVKCGKYSKGHHYSVKNLQMVKLSQIVEFIRTLKIHHEKGRFFNKTFSKTHSKVGKIKFPKITK